MEDDQMLAENVMSWAGPKFRSQSLHSYTLQQLLTWPPSCSTLTHPAHAQSS